MSDRQPLTLCPEELARLRAVAGPYIESIRQLEDQLQSARSTFDNILSAFLVGKGLEGKWNINFDSGLLRPLPMDAEADLTEFAGL